METHAFGFRVRTDAPEGQKRFPISRLLGVALMLAVVSGTAGNAVADPKGFVLTPLAFLGRLPRGRRSSTSSSPTSSTIEAMSCLAATCRKIPRTRSFSRPRSFCCAGESRLRSRGPASRRPGGGVFARPGFLSPITLNDRGDVAFVFLLEPFQWLPARRARRCSIASPLRPTG